jgi:hydroxypyruvate reductase
LKGFRRILVIGGGKASAKMAKAIEELLGDEVTAGVVNVPEPQAGRNRRTAIKLHGATHPLPSEMGEEGVQEMLRLVGNPTEDTLVLCLISGGGSAMLPMPREGITLADKIETTRTLLKAGANIKELNIVRKHLSQVKGGWLAVKLYPATIVSLVISDVVGNRLDSIASGPLYPDSSTFQDAAKVLEKYDLLRRVPTDVSMLIRRGRAGEVPDTPKPGSRYFKRVTNIVIGSNEDACAAAVRRLRALHCRPILVTTGYEGESEDVGRHFGSIPIQAVGVSGPRSWVAGGETTVTVRGGGSGGRNQEFVLGAAMEISGNPGVAIVSIGTDGVDGPTDAAGAIADGSTISRARFLGLEPRASLHRNDSYPFFKGLGDLVMTGMTGTNVNDICVIVKR